MKVIYKYPITDRKFRLIVPYAARMLSIGFDPQGQLCAWFVHNIEGDDKQGFEFLTLATGEETDEPLSEMPSEEDFGPGPHPIPFSYNTTVMKDGLVWHVFSRSVFE